MQTRLNILRTLRASSAAPRKVQVTSRSTPLGYRVLHLYFPRSGMIIALAANSDPAPGNDNLGTHLPQYQLVRAALLSLDMHTGSRGGRIRRPAPADHDA